MPVYERINVTVSLTLIGLALYFVLDFPVEAATVLLFNSPLALVSPQQWLMSLLLAAIAAAGTHAGTGRRAEDRLHDRKDGQDGCSRHLFRYQREPAAASERTGSRLPYGHGGHGGAHEGIPRASAEAAVVHEKGHLGEMAQGVF